MITDTTPLVVFSHSPLYKLYRPWNFWTDDAEQVQVILKKFKAATVIHGHTHQMLSNRIGDISFHGMLSTAWPWPYAPQGLPELTVQMGRPDPFDPNDGCGDGQGQSATYGVVTAQEVALWKTETETLAASGSRVFHSGDELGTTVGVSCDRCHPDGSNTHPETYPKFQARLGRVALLRDMINWCLQHPVRAEPMSADDPRMRAMEADIYAQRRGKVLEYGKH